MFTIHNLHDYMTFEIVELFEVGANQPWEEYALQVRGKSAFLSFDKRIHARRVELKKLYTMMSECYATLKGSCCIPTFSYENDFSLEIKFDGKGGIFVASDILDHDLGNSCHIEFETDQTFIKEMLQGMKADFGF